MRIEQITSSTVNELWAEVQLYVEQSEFLEEAAQELATALHKWFEESVVIARVFLTIPFGGLPPANKEFVQKLADSAGTASELRAITPVLSLIGTHGQEEDWCDRRKSKGHVGIPLISLDFVDAVPMVSRLLKDLGIPLEWVDSHDAEIIIETIGQTAGLFFVQNAAEATDHQGRKIITSQEFVSAYDVKSVFGVGGAYDWGEVIVIIVFCRDAFSRATAERFLALTNLFTSKTSSLVVARKIFCNGHKTILPVREGDMVGKTISHYKILDKLGEGGMGEVWLAKHQLLARPAAVKLIRQEVLVGGKSDEAFLKRFQREARATANLHSPHTVELYDFGVTENGSFYYVMELLTGMDLGSMVEKFGPLSPERTVMLLRQACRSLSEAHGAGLVHRDIKPANLYACKLGPDYDFLKVLDFGMVKVPIGEDATQLTAIGSSTGTPAFMAPELALGDVEVDGRADIYALGCVAYWLLTGMLLFEAKSPARMLIHHIQTRPKPPSEVSEVDIPKDLERVIMACLEKAPKERPSSVSELWSMLGEIKFDRPWDQNHAQRWWKLHRPDLVAN